MSVSLKISQSNQVVWFNTSAFRTLLFACNYYNIFLIVYNYAWIVNRWIVIFGSRIVNYSCTGVSVKSEIYLTTVCLIIS